MFVGGTKLQSVSKLKWKKNTTFPSLCPESNPDYFLSLTEDILQSSHQETGSVIKPEEIWNAYLNVDAGSSGSSNELWSNPVGFEDPFLQVSSRLSTIWDLGSQQAGDSGTDNWSASGFPFDDPDSQVYPKNAEDSDNK